MCLNEMIDAFMAKKRRSHGNGYVFPELSTSVDSAEIANAFNLKRVTPWGIFYVLACSS